MGKDKYLNRIERLFSDLQPSEPEPEKQEPSHIAPADALDASSLLPTALELPANPEAEQQSDSSPARSGSSVGQEPQGFYSHQVHSGWDHFLDGIRRSEHMGFEYNSPQESGPAKNFSGSRFSGGSFSSGSFSDSSEGSIEVVNIDVAEVKVAAINVANNDGVDVMVVDGNVSDNSATPSYHTNTAVETEDLKMELSAPIMVDGHEIGILKLERETERQWTKDEVELVNSVVQQLAQQMETLRLLDEAQHSRSKAEEAFRRLARQSGQTIIEDPEVVGRLQKFNGWAEDGSPLKDVIDANSDVKFVAESAADKVMDEGISTPLRVSGKLVGKLSIGGEKDLSADDVDLVETVAQRLAQQMENLRLLEESRRYQNETEEAIRRLTFQSWQAFLSSTSTARLGYQYDHNIVTPLDQLAQISADSYPLKVREEVIGSLAIEGPMFARQDTEDLINVISDRLSIHLDGLRLAEQREQALTETETLYNISARLSTAQSLEEALTAVSEPTRDSGVRDSRLFFVSLDEKSQPEGLSLAVVWYPDLGAQQVPVNAPFLLENYPIYWQVLRDPNSPMVISDVWQDSRLTLEAREMFAKTGARAVVVLPLSISGRWVGAIFLNWEEPHEFSLQETRLYASLSRQAAVVVNNRLLLDQTRKRAQELQTVAQVSTAASTLLDPAELLQSVVDLAKSSFSLYHTQVYHYHGQEGYYEVVAGAGEIGRQIVHEHLLVLNDSQSVVARAGRERRVVIANDVQNEPGFMPMPRLPHVRSEMAIPMIVGDRLMGVFNVQADSINRFTREDARIYTTLASQVAVALQNAELYAEQAATVERLRELDHLKSAFLANMSHELRTPLNSILGFSEVLLLELDGPLNEVMNNDIRLIEKNGKHLLSLINDVLDMAKIEAGKMNLSFDKFIVRDLIEETLDITSSLVREKCINLHITADSQDRMELVADRVRLRQVMINIVSNAVKFTEKGSIAVCAVQFPEQQKLQIRVKDSGMGVPIDKLELIFESFSQVDTSTTRKTGGTGLGLPISRRLVEMHGGKLWAESSGILGEGSTLIIELPFVAVTQ